MAAFFQNSEMAGRSDELWPKQKILAALKKRYKAIDDLGEESGFAIYGVTDGDVRFAVVMAIVEGAKDKVSEVGFLARFSGFNLSQSQLDSVNRNLHISIASFHTDGDLYLIGGVAASGAFREGTFLLILEAWRRDLLVILQSMSLSQSLADAHPAARLETAMKFATNRAPEAAGAAGDLFAAYAGGARRAMASCVACGGRGKTGFPARACADCDGAGFVASPRR
ncbi:MAG: hypothetical protein A3E78_11315 [Alphaproteobacteria bacterium RIFCSPHIGHO2_12_FULL_63_12]|nr:MAG: hypothetical protein A3E78_11315 [Alphaproteobacteria bacterium RIFCSPHIGHO2_12_FULL_63_12]